MSGTTDKGIEDENAGTYYEQYGGVRCFTDKQFTIGGSQYGLDVGGYYEYIAICGLT